MLCISVKSSQILHKLFYSWLARSDSVKSGGDEAQSPTPVPCTALLTSPPCPAPLLEPRDAPDNLPAPCNALLPPVFLTAKKAQSMDFPLHVSPSLKEPSCASVFSWLDLKSHLKGSFHCSVVLRFLIFLLKLTYRAYGTVWLLCTYASSYPYIPLNFWITKFITTTSAGDSSLNYYFPTNFTETEQEAEKSDPTWVPTKWQHEFIIRPLIQEENNILHALTCQKALFAIIKH